MSKTLKKDAVILNLFTKEEGFLFGEDVFVGMENTLVKSVVTKNDAPQTDVEKALFEIEFHYNLLGLELKDENSLPIDIVAKKVLEAYSPVQEESDFTILSEGQVIGLEEQQNEDSIATSINEKNGQGQFSFGELLESYQLKHQNAVSPETYVEEDRNETPSDSDNSHKLSREEKRHLTQQGVMAALNRGLEKLADISEVVKEFVEVSDTTVRNVLIDLTEEGVVNQKKRGTYELVDRSSIQTLVSNETSTIGVAQETKIEEKAVLEKTIESKETDKTKETVLNVLAKPIVPTQQMPQPVQQQSYVPQTQFMVNTPIEDVVVPATKFPDHFQNNDVVEEYLKERGVRPALIKWVLTYRSKNAARLTTAPQEVIDTIETDLEYIGKTSVIEKCITALMRRRPLNLKGDSATGKTTLVRTLSAMTNSPLYTINGSLEANKNTLVGEPSIDVYRRFVVKQGQMTKAMDRDGFGGILYIDEINMMRPDNLALINPITDGRGYFFNDVEKRTVFAHDNFHFISAMNVGYAGVKKMNEATMDRPGAIQLSYPGKNEMTIILTNYAKKINAKGKSEGIPELEMVDIVLLTELYLELINARNVPALARSARNITLMAEYVPVLGYKYALQMVLDKFDEPEEAARIVGVLSNNEILQKIGVDPDELIIQ